MPTRRQFVRLFGIPSIWRLNGATSNDLCIDTLLAQNGLVLGVPSIRNFRVDVLVTLLGVPVFYGKGVGTAFAAIREASGADRKAVNLQFAGGAIPEKAHGLRYNGALEEVVTECNARVLCAAYFGFVTSSSDETYAQSRERILAGVSGSIRYVATEGVHKPGSAVCTKTAILLEDDHDRSLPELLLLMRERYRRADRTVEELPLKGHSVAPTFLYAVWSALQAEQKRSTTNFVHNAKEYSLYWEKASGRRDGAAPQDASAQASADDHFIGHITSRATPAVSTFRLWIDGQSVLPVRIEFQPRPFLKLILEADDDRSRER
jgi:hypothetical protein